MANFFPALCPRCGDSPDGGWFMRLGRAYFQLSRRGVICYTSTSCGRDEPDPQDLAMSDTTARLICFAGHSWVAEAVR